MFKKKPTPKEQLRENDRALRRVGREMDRDRMQLEREEHKLEAEIRRMAKDPKNNDAIKIMAKQLVNIRKQKSRALNAKTKVSGVSAQAHTMAANVKMADAMKTATGAMGQMNKQMNPQEMAHTMQEFSRQNMKMGMTEEMINDTLDDILGESGDEEEEQSIVNQVLDEIGIDITGKLMDAPSAPRGETSKASLPSEEEIQKQLERLRTS
ncbi:unnamed protein product [Cyprideis torosa]|uniref:Uncharacterized protein n=1 Tax=Cyprideis torosa TaxID=163714 RepID=A0A7R8WPJ8_9CRUS|nr:unnamed protein product [Cyprideis torosa]CAG0900833.1 unnamed protein product [Cyprideis torosa]